MNIPTGAILSSNMIAQLGPVAIDPAANFLAGHVTSAFQEDMSGAYNSVNGDGESQTAYHSIGDSFGSMAAETIQTASSIANAGGAIIQAALLIPSMTQEIVAYTVDKLVAYTLEVTGVIATVPVKMAAYTGERTGYWFSYHIVETKDILKEIQQDMDEALKKQKEEDEKEEQKKEDSKIKQKISNFSDDFKKVNDDIQKGVNKFSYIVRTGPEKIEKAAKKWVSDRETDYRIKVSYFMNDLDDSWKNGADKCAYKVGFRTAKIINDQVRDNLKASYDELEQKEKASLAKQVAATNKAIMVVKGIFGM